MEKEVGLGSKKGNSGDIQRRGLSDECFAGMAREGRRGRGRGREDDRSDVPEASRWLVVPLHRALFRATAARDRLVDLPLDSYHTRPTFRWSFMLPSPPLRFFNRVALSTRVRFPQRRVFRRWTVGGTDIISVIISTLLCTWVGNRRTMFWTIERERFLSEDNDCERRMG